MDPRHSLCAKAALAAVDYDFHVPTAHARALCASFLKWNAPLHWSGLRTSPFAAHAQRSLMWEHRVLCLDLACVEPAQTQRCP